MSNPASAVLVVIATIFRKPSLSLNSLSTHPIPSIKINN